MLASKKQTRWQEIHAPFRVKKKERERTSFSFASGDRRPNVAFSLEAMMEGFRSCEFMTKLGKRKVWNIQSAERFTLLMIFCDLISAET